MKTKTLIIIASVSLFILLFAFVLYPAHISTTVVCYPEVFEEQYSNDYYIVGNTNFNTTTQKITITVPEEDRMTLKHELIHVSQFQSRNPISCRLFGLEVFLREVEAYSGQYYPDVIYNLFYEGLN